DAEAVIAGAEEIVRRAAGREEARRRRRDRNERERHRRREEQDREAAQRRERERAEEERLRAEADGARRGGLRGGGGVGGGGGGGAGGGVPGRPGPPEAGGGSVPDCFAAVPDPRKRRGRRHSLPCVLTLVVMAMLHGKTKLADILAWTGHADQEMLAAAGARAGKDGRRQAPCP